MSYKVMKSYIESYRVKQSHSKLELWINSFIWLRSWKGDLRRCHFCPNPIQPKSNWQLQPSITDWLTVGLSLFSRGRTTRRRRTTTTTKTLTKKNQLLRYVWSWNLVSELTIAQLVEMWSKIWYLTLLEIRGEELDSNRVRSILYNVWSWNLVCDLNVGQLEELWSKNW